jgi:hypothetical protein
MNKSLEKYYLQRFRRNNLNHPPIILRLNFSTKKIVSVDGYYTNLIPQEGKSFTFHTNMHIIEEKTFPNSF